MAPPGSGNSMTEEERASEGRGREASLYIRPPYTRQFDKFFCRKKGKRKGKGGAGEPPPLIKEDKFAAKRSFLPLFFPSPEGKRKEGHSTKFTKSPGGNRERASPYFFPCLWVFLLPPPFQFHFRVFFVLSLKGMSAGLREAGSADRGGAL